MDNMKAEQHEEGEKEYEETIRYLETDGLIKHRKMIVDGCVLASANITNLALHKLNRLAESKDLKHNRLEGFIKRERYFGEQSEDIARKHRRLEDLKYGIVHGKNKNEGDVKDAIETYNKLKEMIKEVLENVK